MLKSHDSDLNSDTYDFQPILKYQTVSWSKTLTTDFQIQDLLKYQCVANSWHGIAQRSRNSRLWPTSETPGVKGYCCDSAGSSKGFSLPQKQNTQRAEWWACQATPTQFPRILAGRQRTQDQGSPLHKYRRGRGSSGELTQGFHPGEAHFRGMWLFPHLDRTLPWALCGCAEPWINRHVPQTRLFCFGVASLRTSPRLVQTLLWEDQAGSVHTWCSVTIQTLTKTVSNGQIEDTWEDK